MTRRLRVLSLLACTAACFTLPAAAASAASADSACTGEERPAPLRTQPQAGPVAELPFLVDDERLYVTATVNGRTHCLIVDTGFFMTALDSGAADRLRLPLRDIAWNRSSGGAGTSRDSMRVARADGIRLGLGGAPVGPLEVLVLPLDRLLGAVSGRRIDGIIGADLFARFVVEADFGSNTLRLYAPGTRRPAAAAVVMPVDVRGGVPFTDGTVTLPGGRRLGARFMIDLGAKANLLLTEPFAARHGLDTLSSLPSFVTPFGAGMAGETRYRFFRADSVSMGAGAAMAWTRVVTGISVGGTLRSSDYDGLLGTALLRSHRVVFDLPQARVIFEPLPSSRAGWDVTLSGLHVVSTVGDRTARRIVHVVPRSPAEEAGLAPGDEIVSVDGVPAASIGLGSLRERLSSTPGRRVTLDVLRSGARRRLVLTLRPLI